MYGVQNLYRHFTGTAKYRLIEFKVQGSIISGRTLSPSKFMAGLGCQQPCFSGMPSHCIGTGTASLVQQLNSR